MPIWYYVGLFGLVMYFVGLVYLLMWARGLRNEGEFVVWTTLGLALLLAAAVLDIIAKQSGA